MSAIRIIDLNRGDSERIRQVVEIYLQAFRKESEERALREIEDRFGAGRISLVAMDQDDDNVVGWIAAMLDTGRSWELNPLVVRLDRRRQGIGRALVTDLESILVGRDAYTVFLTTDDLYEPTSLTGFDLYPNVFEHLARIQSPEGNPYRFYEKVGYTIVGAIPDLNGLGRPDIILSKRLTDDDSLRL